MTKQRICKKTCTFFRIFTDKKKKKNSFYNTSSMVTTNNNIPCLKMFIYL